VVERFVVSENLRSEHRPALLEIPVEISWDGFNGTTEDDDLDSVINSTIDAINSLVDRDQTRRSNPRQNPSPAQNQFETEFTLDQSAFEMPAVG